MPRGDIGLPKNSWNSRLGANSWIMRVAPKLNYYAIIARHATIGANGMEPHRFPSAQNGAGWLDRS